MKLCPFCEPQLQENENIVLGNELCVFICQPQPVLVGSGLIVPRAHRETVFDLTAEEWQATYSLLHEAKSFIDNTHQPDGYNVGWNSGDAAGQHAFHSHLHVIPRYADEPFAGRGIRSWLKRDENRRPA